ncbi:MAG: endoribonuclease YicC domain-containing protein, partial [Burkholderiaceae bacterium]
VAALVESREREGEKLVAVLMQRLQRLRELARDAQPLVPQVVARQQQRFLDRWTEALEVAGAAAQTVPAQALQERAMTEAASYAIRIDVAEELARLTAHLDEIERLLKQGGEVGKRLDFLIQELQREANTLGSKSAALELTQISVEMKVAVEQMREQVQNIE